MKKILYLILALVLPLMSFADENVKTLFDKGNAAYAKSQYKQAIAAYSQIVNDGYQSPAVYFNLGNAFYRNGDIAPALLYYEKAHKLSPGDDDINFNIRFTNLKTTDRVEESPDFFLVKWWHGLVLAISANTLAILSILLVFVGSLLLVIYFFSGSIGLKKTSFFSAVILLVLALLTMFIANRQESYFAGNKQAIIFSGTVNIKSAPADKATTIFVLHEGTKVNVLDTEKGWVKMKLANGNQGWIKITDIKNI